MYLIFKSLILFLCNVFPLILAVAFFTLAERKTIATIQRRKGPNNVIFLGILQPFADALKALLKELIFPSKIDSFFFFLGPLFTFALSIFGWFLIPMAPSVYYTNYAFNVLFFFVISALGFYGILFASWASNSKYALFAAFRGIAQVISYEIFISLTLLPIIMLVNSWNLSDIIWAQQDIWNFFLFSPLSVIFLIGLLAETNRIPFDLPEAEAEIVAGYNIEYSGFIFALFFLGEYSNMLINCFIFTIFFLGGWWPVTGLTWLTYFFSDTITYVCFFFFKALILAFLWIFIRACLPRFRYDQMMDLAWKSLLPICMSLFFFFVVTMKYVEGFVYPHIV